MKQEVLLAKNGEYTLIVNDINIYSKYSPKRDAEIFINKEFKKDVRGYLLVGLGLGYHLEALLNLAGEKNIYILLLSQQELIYFEKYSQNKEILKLNNISLINPNIFCMKDLSNYQIIIPLSWMKAINFEHPLYDFLENIKIQQMSQSSFKEIMKQNFESNIMQQNISSTQFKNKFKGKPACLVSAGPSLDITIELLKKIKDKFFILCVGAALKTLLAKGIQPNAVILTDPSSLVGSQFINTEYTGMLYYLSTANYSVIKTHKGNKCTLFQSNYTLSEEYAEKNRLDLLETGGSVSTAGFSLLQYMGFECVVLFGQDLGFKENNTHSNFSTSNIILDGNKNFRKIKSNSGELINTKADLNIFRKWFEQAAVKSNQKIYNTAFHGAKIEGIPFISEPDVLKMYASLSNDEFTISEVK